MHFYCFGRWEHALKKCPSPKTLSTRRSIAIVAWALLLSVSAPLAQASEASTRRAVETVDTGWQVICRSIPADRTKLNCSTLYELVGAKDHNRILSLELLNRDNAVRLLVVAPLGVDLRNGIDISGSGFETFKMIVETCQTGGCLSTRQMPSKTLEQWKISKTLILEFKDSSGALIRSEVSLTGFGAAFSLAEKS